jgi:hypothetical protein
MSARDSFEFNALPKAMGVGVLLVDFHDLAVGDFHSRVQMLKNAGLVARVDSTPLAGASWTLETFRPRVVFVRLREGHMYGERSAAMDAFLGHAAALRGLTVIPVVSQRSIIDHFRHHLSRISPMYLDTAFAQEDLLNILGSCGFSRSLVRPRSPRAHTSMDLNLASL